MWHMKQITFPLLCLWFKHRLRGGRSCPIGKSPCCISFQQCPMGLCWPFPASVSIVSAAVTSDHCVCVCRSPQRCTCSATPRAKGTNRLCETVAASRDGSSLTRKWCVSPHTLSGTNMHSIQSKNTAILLLVSCKKNKRQKDTAVVFYDVVIIIVYASPYILPRLCCWLCEMTNGPWNVHS